MSIPASVQATAEEIVYRDALAAFLACCHYDAAAGCWQVEVIRDGREPVVGNFEMRAAPPRLVAAIQQARRLLRIACNAVPEQPVDAVLFRELEGG